MIITGTIIKGERRGKKLGFPTANMQMSIGIPEGIYISETELAGKFYQSLTFVGIAITFNAKKFLAETYILDFDEDIYDEQITVTLIKKIRDNKKFDSAEELVEQMKEDEKIARGYFGDKG